MTNLDSAIRLALRHGTTREEMIRSRWCETYNATPEEFDAALLRATTKIPPNSTDAMEGK